MSTDTETLQAAIDKLQALISERKWDEYGLWLVDTEDAHTVSQLTPITNDELMITLHRTHKNILAILVEGIQAHKLPSPSPIFLELAHSVLGKPATA